MIETKPMDNYSAHEYLYKACRLTAERRIGEGICWAKMGLISYPDDPDLHAFLTVIALRFYNSLKEHELGTSFKDWHGEKLLDMKRDSFTIRAYIALLLYYMAKDFKSYENKCVSLIVEMNRKFPRDICFSMAVKLMTKKREGRLPKRDIKRIRTVYEGLKLSLIEGSFTFSDYICSIEPLYAEILDDLKWPRCIR